MPPVALSICQDKECQIMTTWEEIYDEECSLFKPVFTHKCPDNTQEAIGVSLVERQSCDLTGTIPAAIYEARDDEELQICYRTRYCAETCTVTSEVIAYIHWEYCNGNIVMGLVEAKKRGICNSTGATGQIASSFNWYPCVDENMDCEMMGMVK